MKGKLVHNLQIKLLELVHIMFNVSEWIVVYTYNVVGGCNSAWMPLCKKITSLRKLTTVVLITLQMMYMLHNMLWYSLRKAGKYKLFIELFLSLRRSHTHLCRNWELLFSFDCSKSCHFPNTNLPGQREDKNFPSDGCQRPRKPHCLWEYRYLEREDSENPTCIPLYTWLLYH